MKTTSLLITIAAAITTFAVTTNAETQDQANVSNQDVRPVSVQYGQGGAVTFFKPTTPEFKVAVYKASQVTSAAAPLAQKKLQWRSQSIPNGATITYSVVE